MENEEIYSHSPFDRSSSFSPKNQALLLQFALISLNDSSRAPLLEHLRLFTIAFSNQEKNIAALTSYVKKKPRSGTLSPRTKRESIRKFIPFLHLCKSDPGLWLFLVKQGHHLDAPKNLLALFQELYSEDLATISLRMSSDFTARGFTMVAKECIALFRNIQSYHV